MIMKARQEQGKTLTIKELEEIQQILNDFGIYNSMNLIDTLKNIRFLEKQIAINSKKYLIISIYDSGWGFSVCENGKIINMDNKEIKFYYDIYNNNLNYEDIFAKLDFDLIILCENGGIDILKGELI